MTPKVFIHTHTESLKCLTKLIYSRPIGEMLDVVLNSQKKLCAVMSDE